jgi:hypothetical protein
MLVKQAAQSPHPFSRNTRIVRGHANIVTQTASIASPSLIVVECSFIMHYRTGILRGALVGTVVAVGVAIYAFVDIATSPPQEMGFGGPDFALAVVGFLLLVYGVPAIILAAGVGALVVRMTRSRRIKRGLCPRCAYDLRGGRKQPSDSSVCSECGDPAR